LAHKHRLRLNRAGTVINMTARQQESTLGKALQQVVLRLTADFDLQLVHQSSWRLHDVVDGLKREFPEVDFFSPSSKSSIKPDGGILSLTDADDQLYPILIAEVKNQGTNDLRLAEGKPKQAQGNAIERLGKNVIGFRTALLKESIVPFVCFGYGIDFEEGSSILERVATIAMFGRLNEIHLVNQGEGGRFNRGSFYFRRPPWTEGEMEEIMFEIASRSIHYYLAKYGYDYFVKPDDR
jgi:type II restriction enzyme